MTTDANTLRAAIRWHYATGQASRAQQDMRRRGTPPAAVAEAQHRMEHWDRISRAEGEAARLAWQAEVRAMKEELVDG